MIYVSFVDLILLVIALMILGGSLGLQIIAMIDDGASQRGQQGKAGDADEDPCLFLGGDTENKSNRPHDRDDVLQDGVEQMDA
jgi:hypothetical protein